MSGPILTSAPPAFFRSVLEIIPRDHADFFSLEVACH